MKVLLLLSFIGLTFAASVSLNAGGSASVSAQGLGSLISGAVSQLSNGLKALKNKVNVIGVQLGDELVKIGATLKSLATQLKAAAEKDKAAILAKIDAQVKQLNEGVANATAALDQKVKDIFNQVETIGEDASDELMEELLVVLKKKVELEEAALNKINEFIVQLLKDKQNISSEVKAAGQEIANNLEEAINATIHTLEAVIEDLKQKGKEITAAKLNELNALKQKLTDSIKKITALNISLSAGAGVVAGGASAGIGGIIAIRG